MRGSVSKNINDYIPNIAVLTKEEKAQEMSPALLASARRRKKVLWKTLSWMEKTVLSADIRNERKIRNGAK